jgi:hypothetical protein
MDQPLISLVRIAIFPVKSLDGMVVHQARVLPTGALEGDRQFALVDRSDRMVNAKRTPRIQQIRTRADLASRTIELAAEGAQRGFQIDRDRRALEAWLGEFLGLDVRLIENVTGGFPDDLDSPGPTIVGRSTLETVASWYEGLSLDEVRRRFRANLEIDGCEPFWEDRLYAAEGAEVAFRVGGVPFHGTNPCQRCAVPTRGSETGAVDRDFMRVFEARRQEALPWWAARARFDHFYRLAVNTRPASTAGGILRTGDQVVLV